MHNNIVYYPDYSTLFNGCFNRRELSTINHLNITVNCDPFNKCFNEKNKSVSIEKAIPYANTIIGGFSISPALIFSNEKYKKKLYSYFSRYQDYTSVWTIRRDILRLFINPSEYLYHQLLKERKVLLKYNHTIGVQLRMGGNYSDHPEPYVGVPFSRIDDVINQIKQVISDYHWQNNVQVYISSDSSYTINYIRNKTRKMFPVIESLIYKHGHSVVFKSYVPVMNKVISDFYYMSISDYLLVTWPSSMGKMMCYISDEEKCHQVLNWKVVNKRDKIPERV